jgi:hypothetical protein
VTISWFKSLLFHILQRVRRYAEYDAPGWAHTPQAGRNYGGGRNKFKLCVVGLCTLNQVDP